MQQAVPRKVLIALAGMIAFGWLAVVPAANAAPTLTLAEDCDDYPEFSRVDIHLSGLPPNEPFELTYNYGDGGASGLIHADENGSFDDDRGTSDHAPRTYKVTVEWLGGSLEATQLVDCRLPAGSPTADAGADQTDATGDTVNLDGGGSSDPDGDPLSYSWTQTDGPPVTVLGAGTATPHFTAPAGPAALTFRLEVCDDSSPRLCEDDKVTIRVKGPPVTVPPVLTVTEDCSPIPDSNSIDMSVHGLPGYESFTGTLRDYDADGTLVSTLGPVQFSADGDGKASLSLGALVGHTYEVTVQWPGGTVIASTVVDCTPPVGIPTANAGADQTVDYGDPVSLDGSGSSDPDGDPLTYSWTQTDGSPVKLDGADTATPSFTAPVGPKELRFKLEVCDDGSPALCADDSVTVDVSGNDYATKVIVNRPFWANDGHHRRRSFVVKVTNRSEGPFAATADDIDTEALVDGSPTGIFDLVSSKVVKPDKRVKFRYIWRYTNRDAGDDVELSGCVNADGDPDSSNNCSSFGGVLTAKP